MKRGTKRILILALNILFFVVLLLLGDKYLNVDKNETLWEALLILPFVVNLFLTIFHFVKKNKYTAYSFLISIALLILLYTTAFFYLLGKAMPVMRY
jgi:cytochrome bd-type quinol oxidase subunit 2